MKKTILAATILLAAVTLSRAGVSLAFGLTLPLPPLPQVVVTAPPVVVAPPAVVYRAPAPVYQAPTPVCQAPAPAVIVSPPVCYAPAPRVVCAPATGVYFGYGAGWRGNHHYAGWEHRGRQHHGWHR